MAISATYVVLPMMFKSALRPPDRKSVQTSGDALFRIYHGALLQDALTVINQAPTSYAVFS